jgi:PadR family transcriptional regulator
MPMSPEPRSKPELVPGTLILLVLRVLESGPLHGYAIAQRIRQVSGDVLRVEEGSLYPALQKMLLKGWVRAEWELSDSKRRVRSYRLTAAGRKQLESERAGYDHVNRAIQAVLKLA